MDLKKATGVEGGKKSTAGMGRGDSGSKGGVGEIDRLTQFFS